MSVQEQLDGALGSILKKALGDGLRPPLMVEIDAANGPRLVLRIDAGPNGLLEPEIAVDLDDEATMDFPVTITVVDREQRSLRAHLFADRLLLN